MKKAYLKRGHTVRTIIIGSLLMSCVGGISMARADDDDWRWRDHQQQEHNWRSHHRDHERWDHHYWDNDRDVYVYRPPTVYYAPAPPTGLDFVFRVGR